MGNLQTDTIRQLDEKRQGIRFVESSVELTQKCIGCKWYRLCRGGCRRDYTCGENASNYYCESYKAFLEYAYPKLLQIAAFCRQRNLPGRVSE